MLGFGLGLTDPRGSASTSALPALKGYTATLAVYDPSDLTTMWQDRAGTTTQAVGGQPLGYMKNVKTSATALHMTAIASDARRPILAVRPVTGVRNLLTYSEGFDNAAWVKASVGVTANAAVAPDSTTSADKVYPTVTAGRIYQSPSTSGSSVFSFYAKAGEMTAVNIRAPNNGPAAIAYLDLNTGTVSGVNGAYGSASATSVGNGWYRFVFVLTAALTNISFAPCDAVGSTASTPSGTNGIYAWGAQLETGGTATAYQKVVSAYEVSESGVAPAYNPTFDGVDDGLSDAATSGLPTSATILILVKTTDTDAILFSHGVTAWVATWDATAGAISSGAGTPTVKVDGTGYTTRSALKAAINDGTTHTVLIEAANLSTWTTAGFGAYNGGAYPFSGTMVPVAILNAGGADYATALTDAQAWALELKSRLGL